MRFTDPIIAEVRAVRDAHAARFGYDVEAIFKDIRASERASGRTYVRNPPRRVLVDAGEPTRSARRSVVRQQAKTAAGFPNAGRRGGGSPT